MVKEATVHVRVDTGELTSESVHDQSMLGILCVSQGGLFPDFVVPLLTLPSGWE